MSILKEGGEFLVALDNSGGVSQSRVYVNQTVGRTLYAFDTSGNPVNFSESASFIAANAITGTPSGPFGATFTPAVDSHGNIYVVDISHHVADEFGPSGKFLQEFTAAEVPGGFSPDVDGVAIDPTNGNVLIISEGFEGPRTDRGRLHLALQRGQLPDASLRPQDDLRPDRLARRPSQRRETAASRGPCPCRRDLPQRCLAIRLAGALLIEQCDELLVARRYCRSSRSPWSSRTRAMGDERGASATNRVKGPTGVTPLPAT